MAWGHERVLRGELAGGAEALRVVWRGGRGGFCDARDRRAAAHVYAGDTQGANSILAAGLDFTREGLLKITISTGVHEQLHHQL